MTKWELVLESRQGSTYKALRNTPDQQNEGKKHTRISADENVDETSDRCFHFSMENVTNQKHQETTLILMGMSEKLPLSTFSEENG